MKKYLIIGGVLLGAFLIFSNEPAVCFGSECSALESPQSQIIAKAKNGEINLIDVREQNEWDEGHIEGAILLPLASINETTTAGLSKDKPSYIYCRSGRRAGIAVESMKTLGFNNVINLGGIIEWQEKGGVLVK